MGCLGFILIIVVVIGLACYIGPIVLLIGMLIGILYLLLLAFIKIGLPILTLILGITFVIAFIVTLIYISPNYFKALNKVNNEYKKRKIEYSILFSLEKLNNIIEENWVNNNISKDYISSMIDNGINIKNIFLYLVKFSITIGGILITAVTSIFHFILLLIYYIVIYPIRFKLWLTNKIYLIISKISTVCPNCDCQTKFIYPMFECECGTKHIDLFPSKYDLLYRKCSCGKKIYTLFLMRKKNLKSMCPECKTMIPTGGKTVQHTIPVIGVPSSGKTTYINLATYSLVNNIHKKSNWNVEYYSKTDRYKHEKAMKFLFSGKSFGNTSNKKFKPYKIHIKSNKSKFKRQIYIYDVDGNIFYDSNHIYDNKLYQHTKHMIFIIDPLSLRTFREENSHIDFDKYGYYENSIGLNNDDILNKLSVNLESMLNLKPQDKFNINIAVVISKFDIQEVQQIISKNIHNELMSRRHIIKEFLERYGEGNFVRTIESKFKNVEYFTCSSLADLNNKEINNSNTLEDPILWLLETSDSKMKV